MLADRGAGERVRIRSGGIANYARDGMLPSLDARLVLREDGIHLGEDGRGDIGDPAMKGEDVFRACRDEIKRCLEVSFDRLLAEVDGERA
jgi:hypothetical protein